VQWPRGQQKSTVKLKWRKIALHWSLVPPRPHGTVYGVCSGKEVNSKSLKAKVWASRFCILQARHRHVSGQQRLSCHILRNVHQINVAAAALPLATSPFHCVTFVATFYAFFQRLRLRRRRRRRWSQWRLLFQFQDKCDSIKPCHAPCCSITHYSTPSRPTPPDAAKKNAKLNISRVFYLNCVVRAQVALLFTVRTSQQNAAWTLSHTQSNPNPRTTHTTHTARTTLFSIQLQ